MGVASRHQLSLGVTRSFQTVSAASAAYNGVGTGTADGLTMSTKAMARPVIQPWATAVKAQLSGMHAMPFNGCRLDFVAGVRHTKLNRTGFQSDGSAPSQPCTKPSPHPGWPPATSCSMQQVYASWGEGVQALVAPHLRRPIRQPAALARPAHIMPTGSGP